MTSDFNFDPKNGKGQYQRTKKIWFFLALSIVIDIIGAATLALPFVGEAFDLIWAPISAYILKEMYAERAFSRLQFWKEILPFTDIIPVATLNWFVEYTSFGRWVGRRFGRK